MGSWDHRDVVACYLLSQRLPNSTFLRLSTCPTARVRWQRLAKDYTVKGILLKEVSWSREGQGKKNQVWKAG
jgi:hypothetical protein